MLELNGAALTLPRESLTNVTHSGARPGFGQSLAFTGFLYLVLLVLTALYGGFWQATGISASTVPKLEERSLINLIYGVHNIFDSGLYAFLMSRALF